jgi:hypothetical protein
LQYLQFLQAEQDLSPEQVALTAVVGFAVCATMVALWVGISLQENSIVENNAMARILFMVMVWIMGG